MRIEITAEDDGMILKAFLYGRLNLSTRLLKRLKYRSDGRGLLRNGEPVTVRAVLHTGDSLTLALEDTQPSSNIEPHAHALEILYEDDDMICINKPPFMPTHPSRGHIEDTAANALAALFNARGTPLVFRCGSRLDRDTSGVLPVSKNQRMASMFFHYHQNGKIEKTYLAVVHGEPPAPAGTVLLPIGRIGDSIIMRTTVDDGLPARTDYKLLYTWCLPQSGTCSLLAATPVTGRTHQLRVHFAAIGCPILGDTLYGEAAAEINRQALHAARLRFPGPTGDGLITVTAPPPPDFFALPGFPYHNSDVGECFL